MNRWLAVFAASCALVVFGLFLIDRLVSTSPAGLPGASFPHTAVEPAVPSVSASAHEAGPGGGLADVAPKLKLAVPKFGTAAIPAAASSDAAAPGQRRLTRSGTLALLVPNIEQSLAAVRAVAAAQAGALTSLDDEHPGNGDAGRDASVELSVPADRFERTMDTLATLGGVRSRSVSAEDVTDQLIDDEARLRNLRRTEADMLRARGAGYRLSC